jgi:hypothetical protein
LLAAPDVAAAGDANAMYLLLLQPEQLLLLGCDDQREGMGLLEYQAMSCVT